MFKKLSLAIVALIFIMSALCIPALAEPSDNESGESVSSTEYASSDFESGESGDETSSEDEVSSEDEDSSAEESSSQYYIPDDSDYFTESLNSLGGTVTSGSLTYESGYSSKPSGGKEIFNLKLKLQQALWIPLALICVCVLVLVIFNRIYIVKYKKIDLEAKYKAQQKAAQQRAARQRTDQAATKKPSTHDQDDID